MDTPNHGKTGLITPELVREAVRLATPLAMKLIAENNWGPDWVEGVIMAPGLAVPVTYTIGEPKPWNPDWRDGPELDFSEIAMAKAVASHRTGLDSRVVALIKPWLLEKDEYRYPGAKHRDGITAGHSGVFAEVDEAISGIVIDITQMLVYLKCRECDSRKESRIA